MVTNVNQVLATTSLLDLDTLKKLPTKFQLFKESLRQNDDFLYVAFEDYCLFSEAVLLPKFKIFDFLKYGGIGCPKAHLMAYCTDMTLVAYDQKPLVKLFQKILSKPTTDLFSTLDMTKAFLT